MVPIQAHAPPARVLVAFLVACTTLPSAASARILTVDCSGSAEYETIQDAVDASAAGDTIGVAPCVYEEQVIVPNRELTIVGAGSDVTEITSSDVAGAVRYSYSPLTLRDLTVRGTSSGASAIIGQYALLRMYDCVVGGRMRGIGRVDIRRCSVTRLESTAGGVSVSTVEDSRFGSASFGPFWLSYHGLESTRSYYGEVTTGTSGHCEADSIGHVELYGGPDAYQSLTAKSCVIDSCYAEDGPILELADCRIGDIVYLFDRIYYPWIRMSGCLTTGEIVVSDSWWGRPVAVSGSGVRGIQDTPFIEHSTFLRGLRIDVADLFEGFYVRSNLVMGETLIESDDEMVVSHNNFAGGLDLSAPAAQVFENIDANPQFCNPLAGDYSLHSTSPCVGAAHDGGVIGAFGVGCSTSVESSTWGAIKALYRK